MTRILVADDDRTTRLLLTEILRDGKYTVVAVPDGAAALKKLKEDKFDLALLDVWMPKKNGLEVLSALKKSSKKPKVIVMTSDDTPETLLSAIREEAYQYVAKPIEPKSLLTLVRETLTKTSKTLPIEVISARPDLGGTFCPVFVGSGRTDRSVHGAHEGGIVRGSAALGGAGVSRVTAQRSGMGRETRPEPQSADFLSARQPDGAVSDCGSRSRIQICRTRTRRNQPSSRRAYET